MSPFDFINSITFDKTDLFQDPQADKDYVPFIINRGLSYFPDTVFYANEVNQHNTIPKRWQFDFLTHSIPKRKRFSKWTKKESSTELIAAVASYYKYSTRRAAEVIPLLTEQQLEEIKLRTSRGGR